ncbi:MAG: CRTAC1 family protein [Planctomycetota bacterium]
MRRPQAILLCTLGGCGEPAANPIPSVPQWFTEITSEVGLDFTHESGATGGLYMPEVMGGGCALFDYDNDGDLDVYLVTGNRMIPEPGRTDAPVNRLYRQEADGRLTDVTSGSGLGDGGYGMGAAVGDIDNDGDADVYVTNYGPDRLYRNRGDGTFEDITDAAGLDVNGWSCSAAFFDYDRDGFLDLFVTQYLDYDPTKRCSALTGRMDYCGPREFPPVHDVLLRNTGDPAAPGFSDVSRQAGLTSVSATGLGVVCEDFNDDDWPDVYVANDAYPNHLWLNRGDGTFHEAAVMMGAAYNVHGQYEAGMGVIAADLDNSSTLDLFVTHLRVESNTHYRNLGGNAGFSDVTGETGLAASSRPYTGFGTAAMDVELDGDLDVAVVNGRVTLFDPLPNASVGPPWNLLAEPNLFYLNDGSGSFELAGESIESFSGPIEVTRGLAVGDFDADGDLDMLISNIQGAARLYRNDAPRTGHWLMVEAVDSRLRRAAIGARITVVCGERRLVRTVTSGSSYLSSHDPRAHFGLGATDRVDRIEVHWPDGFAEWFGEREVDRVVHLTRGEGERRR